MILKNEKNRKGGRPAKDYQKLLHNNTNESNAVRRKQIFRIFRKLYLYKLTTDERWIQLF